jgi:hypothetical protein
MKRWLAILALNLLLVVAFRAIAPAQPLFTDRPTYEVLGQRALAPGCRADIFCYRVLVPAVLERIPLESDLRWRLFEATMVLLSGFVIALATTRALASADPSGDSQSFVSSAAGRRSPRPAPATDRQKAVGRVSATAVSAAPWLATIVAQSSFGLTYTAYDPYTVDPAIYLLGALFALAWFANKVGLAFALGSIGVFVKQTAVLVAAAPAIAALLYPGIVRRKAWVAQGLYAAVLLVAFYVVMDRFNDWPMTSNSPSANFLGGGWLIRWLEEEGPRLAIFYTFAPYGLGWLYAALGFRHAPRQAKALALGAIPAMLALIYVQTTERAIGNFFFAVVPLIVVYLVRLPRPLAFLAALSNGLFTAKVGLSTVWLPSSAILLVPAVVVCLLSLAWPTLTTAKWSPAAASGMRNNSTGSR